ncbi:MAG: hypothetical protein JNK60_00105, partial [Acidobacteria bacterium]|nr:hypothetical protein [Acidobacteriota bacterium]
RTEVLASYGRVLLEIRTGERLAVRERLSRIPAIDDVSLFGTRLHARGASGAGPELLPLVQSAIAGLASPEGVRVLEPSLEDVFVLLSEHEDEAA